MKVENILGRSNSPVKNQFIIRDGTKIYFQSYSTLIAVFDRKTCAMRINADYMSEKAHRKMHDCSIATATTRKYLDIFDRKYCEGWQGDFKFLRSSDSKASERFYWDCAMRRKPTSPAYGY